MALPAFVGSNGQLASSAIAVARGTETGRSEVRGRELGAALRRGPLRGRFDRRDVRAPACSGRQSPSLRAPRPSGLATTRGNASETFDVASRRDAPGSERCPPSTTKRLDNETRVHPRTREIIVTERGAFSRPARAVENWAPAAAGRTVKRARPAFGGWNASYTVVEPRLFGEQRRLASQLAWRRDLGVRCQLARLLFTAPQSARRLGPRVALGRSTLRPQRSKDSRQGAVVFA